MNGHLAVLFGAVLALGLVLGFPAGRWLLPAGLDQAYDDGYDEGWQAVSRRPVTYATVTTAAGQLAEAPTQEWAPAPVGDLARWAGLEADPIDSPWLRRVYDRWQDATDAGAERWLAALDQGNYVAA